LSSRSPNPDAVQALVSDLRDSFTGVVVTDSTFPSGALFLDVRLNQRVWVLMYSPQHDRYGIDELRGDDGFSTGYAHSASSFAEASQILLGLLRAATEAE